MSQTSAQTTNNVIIQNMNNQQARPPQKIQDTQPNTNLKKRRHKKREQALILNAQQINDLTRDFKNFQPTKKEPKKITIRAMITPLIPLIDEILKKGGTIEDATTLINTRLNTDFKTSSINAAYRSLKTPSATEKTS